jgi:hypothetical protein
MPHTWLDTPPTAPGWYWLRRWEFHYKYDGGSRFGEPEVVQVVESSRGDGTLEYYAAGWDSAATFRSEPREQWAGPIELPHEEPN